MSEQNEDIRIYRCVFCGHTQPGPEDGFEMCEECECTELVPVDQEDAPE